MKADRNTKMGIQHSYVSGSSERALLEEPIGTWFDRVADADPTREAVVSLQEGIRWTYSDLQRRTNDLSVAFRRLRLEPGDRVAIWAQNCAMWTAVQLAAAKTGLVLVTINPAGTVEECGYILRKAGCSLLITSSGFGGINHLESIRQLGIGDVSCAMDYVHSSGRLWIVLLREGERESVLPLQDVLVQPSVDELRDLHTAASAVNARDPVSVHYTSGTTGRPKGATLTHRGILNNGYFAGIAMGITANDRYCVILPLYHCGAMVLGNLACLSHGATIVYPSESFHPLVTLKAIESERCTGIGGVPTMFQTLLAQSALRRTDLSSLRTGNVGGAPCPEPLMKRLIRDMNLVDITVGYGMTETSPISFQTTQNDAYEYRVGSVGRIQPHLEAKIVDGDGKVVGLGRPGEILVRGYAVMSGYWEEPHATREAIDSEGWMHTGDVGVLSGSGYLRVIGRTKEIVIRGGENIYPREVEDCLRLHPEIAEVAVFGIDDPVYGEELCAWIKPISGAAISAKQVREHCRSRLANSKIPKYIRLVDSFPMTANGKMQKYRMRKQMMHDLQLTIECTKSVLPEAGSPGRR